MKALNIYIYIHSETKVEREKVHAIKRNSTEKRSENFAERGRSRLYRNRALTQVIRYCISCGSWLTWRNNTKLEALVPRTTLSGGRLIFNKNSAARRD